MDYRFKNIKDLMSKSHSVVEPKKYMVDATELNKDLDGTFANEINSNLDNLSYGEQNGGKNLLYTDEFVGKSVLAENNIGGVAPTGNSITFTMYTTTNDDLSGGNSILYIIRKDGSNSSPVYPNNTLQLTDADRNNFANYRINFVSGLVGKTIKTCQIENGTKATEYEPYIPSVKMIADEVSAQNESLGALGKCKNLLNPTFDTSTHNGITFTRNDDGTYSLSGSCTDTSPSAYVSIIKNFPLEKGKYKLTGAVDENNYIRCIINGSSSGTINIFDHGDGCILDVNETGITITLMIVTTDDTSQTRIIKPMLTTNLSATYDDFVPYTGDGDTLTHDVAELKNDLSGEIKRVDGINTTLTNEIKRVDGLVNVNYLSFDDVFVLQSGYHLESGHDPVIFTRGNHIYAQMFFSGVVAITTTTKPVWIAPVKIKSGSKYLPIQGHCYGVTRLDDGYGIVDIVPYRIWTYQDVTTGNYIGNVNITAQPSTTYGTTEKGWACYERGGLILDWEF